MTVIIDYGVGNLNSIKNMIKKIGFEAVISSQIYDIDKASKLILPGVGSFEYGMNKLRNSSFFELLEKKVIKEKTPILGVCLGAQLLFETSEEGENIKGLGWIRGNVRKFEKDHYPNLKIPHMGWNYVKSLKKSKLMNDMPSEPRFYFVHSYHFELTDRSSALMETEYGYPFISAVEKGNVLGVQFHPEKSHKFGKQLYYNFLSSY